MYIKGKYRAGDSISTLICNNYSLLVAMNSFGIPLGVEQKSVEQVCEENGVDTTTFLAIANLMLRHGDCNYTPSLEGVQMGEIIKYLRNTHKLFNEVRLPHIRMDLVEILSNNRVSKLIIKHFDDYQQEIKYHIRHEEEVLFSYVESLLKGEACNYSIDQFIYEHNNKLESLEMFQDVIVRYFKGDDQKIIHIIHELLSCDTDLAWHTIVEDRLLIPLIKKMEGR